MRERLLLAKVHRVARPRGQALQLLAPKTAKLVLLMMLFGIKLIAACALDMPARGLKGLN